ncbi:MlaA family lipoprotein [Stenoxybacter acetivorans]|uniref:MlaA family lipoprotein n=1 Tax=Stenoxybacter acetivorans TaxID=422441 RepID=UPI0009FF9D83
MDRIVKSALLSVGFAVCFSQPVWADNIQNTQSTCVAAERTGANAVLANTAQTHSKAVNIDPYEGYNRFMFRVNDAVDRNVLTPVARGYRKITPSPVRTGISNVFNNLRDVVSLGSNLLRLDIKRAGEDFVRVGINSTFGLGGLIDIAGLGGVPNNKNTLGDTFSSWGWKNSNYFIYPLGGPSTVRDSIGNTIISVYTPQDLVLQESSGRYGATVLNIVQRRESLLDLSDSLDDAALDRYAYMRDVYMNMRNREVGNPTVQQDDDIDIDSLVSSDEDSAAVDHTAAESTGDASASDVKQATDAAGAATENPCPYPIDPIDGGTDDFHNARHEEQATEIKADDAQSASDTN